MSVSGLASLAYGLPLVQMPTDVAPIPTETFHIKTTVLLRADNFSPAKSRVCLAVIRFAFYFFLPIVCAVEKIPDPTPVEKKFGLIIKSLRLQLEISQERLAELAGMHRTYVADIERGSRNISLRNIEKLSAALGIPMWEVFFEMTRLERSAGKYLPKTASDR